MLVDLHVHCCERSACAVSPERETIEMARIRGLDGIAFCDHERLVPADHLLEINRKYAPFRVFSGIEISVEEEDVLVLGLHRSELERESWNWFSLYEFVNDAGGAIVLAHPFRFHEGIGIDLETCRPHAVEVASVNMEGYYDLAAEAEALARRLPAHRIMNSDAHSSQFVGDFHNILDRPARDDAELAAIIREGAFHPVRRKN